MAHSYNKILFPNKKKWSPDTCYKMDRPGKYYGNWKKPDAKDHILYGSIYMKSPDWANPERQKENKVAKGRGPCEGMGSDN